jgi:hypothetical protein
MEYIHAMEYYLAIKKERTVKIPANFKKNAMLGVRGQMRDHIYMCICMIPFI